MKKILKGVYWFFWGGLLTAVVGGTVLTGYVFSVINHAPTLTKQQLSSDGSTRILDKDGNLLYQTATIQRSYVKYKDIPKQYVNAVVSTENKTFFTDPGVDWHSIASAVYGALRHQGVRGGSTLTQQLVKLSAFSTDSSDRTIDRKIKEAYLAYQVNKAFSKEQIFEYYVNKVFEGQNVYGAQTIAMLYFNKPLKDLNLSQMAIIAGLGQSPSAYNLYTNPKLVEARRNDVLRAMHRNNKISKQRMQDAMAQDVKFGLQPSNSRYVSEHNSLKYNQAYVTSVLKQAKALGFSPNKNGLIIKTGLDPKAQHALYDVANNGYMYNGMTNVQTAGTVVDPKTGFVLAQIGGRHVPDNQMFGLNRATQTNRSSGSTIKPLIDYGPAIEHLGWGTKHPVLDAPYTYAGSNSKLTNYNQQYAGTVPMDNAVTLSLNTPAARTLDIVGGVNASAFLDGVGIANKGTLLAGPDAIGIDTSTAALAGGYSAVANNGKYIPTSYISSITTPDSKIYNIRSIDGYKARQAMDPATAFELMVMMKMVIAKGTAMDAQIDGIAHGVKDGLVGYAAGSGMPDRASSDAWASGFSKGLAISIWTGYDQPKQGYISDSNQKVSVKAYADLMRKIGYSYPHDDWAQPANVTGSNGDYLPHIKHDAKRTYKVKSLDTHLKVSTDWSKLQKLAHNFNVENDKSIPSDLNKKFSDTNDTLDATKSELGVLNSSLKRYQTAIANANNIGQ